MAERTARASLPSTLEDAIPKEMALGITPSETYWSSAGVEMAYLLFLKRKRVWHRRVAAKFKAVGKSPSLAAPYPR